MGTHEMLWRDPLVTPGDRFPLGPPPEFWAESDDEPSEVGTRPFSLRGVKPAPKAEVEPGASYEYDPRRQITLVRIADGTLLPLSKHTKPGATPSAGTSRPATATAALPPRRRCCRPTTSRTDP